ncbi:MAG: penicillin-binding protein 1A [Leptolyngbyaceae bacterium]|nr:penicillin-binding protein 1A [Leptolyngbyaceae bacterium]
MVKNAQRKPLQQRRRKAPVPSSPPPVVEVFRFVRDVTAITAGTILTVTMFASSVAAGGLVGLAISFRNLPDVRVLRDYIPTETSYIYDINGALLDSIHDEVNRDVVTIDEISPELKRAVLAIEDSHFYSHRGINPTSIGRALLVNLEQGRTVEGGSTITMQLVKNLFLTPERSISRKVAEAVLSLRLEQIFTKTQILEMYLNQVYWGHNTYGVETAAQSYFNKSAADLSLAEAAMMAGLIQAPETYSPFINYQVSKQRQAIVLQRMRLLNWITEAEYEAAKVEPLYLGEITSFRQSQSPYITDAVVQELNRRFGEDAVRTGGMRVQTTIDVNFQRQAEAIVRDGHQKIQQQGLYADQIALVAVDPRTHFVKAMVGGINYEESQFNRAIQANRQPGSAFKPFVYYAALASGRYTPGSTIDDSPVSYPDGNKLYSPRNYDGSFYGPISLTRALATSRNVPAIKLGQAVGLDKVIEVCRTLGIVSPIEPVTSLPLGAVDLTPMEMAGAYATFASGGWQSETTFIVQVADSHGNILLDNRPKPQLVLNQWAVASLTEMLKGAIDGGTGSRARLDRPAAGKTGTTSSERDIWFMGYVPQLSVAVWIGNDDYRPLSGGATGGGFAAPLWKEFMTEALKNTPVEDFPASSNFEQPKP